MIDSATLSDRHARAVAGLGAAPRALTIRLIADRDAPLAVRSSLVCAGNLLCRLGGAVAAIEVDTDVELIAHVSGEALRGPAVEVLARLSLWATGGQIPVHVPRPEAPDLTICLGPRPANYDGPIDIFAIGGGWKAWIGIEAHYPLDGTVAETTPLGPWLAAALVAGEVFKHARRLVRGQFAANFAYSLWSGQVGTWATLQDGPSVAGARLPPLHLVGAGAVGQGLIAVLAECGLSDAFIVTLDDDKHDGTNLNRCPLAGAADVSCPKVEVITRRRREAGLEGLEFDGTLTDYVRRGDRSGLPDVLSHAEAEDRYEIVVSAVDKNTSRQDIQGLAPDLVVGASTVGLSAKSNLYQMAPGKACLGCHNAAEKDGDRLRKVEQEVRCMTEVELRKHLDGRVENVDAIVTYLQGGEKCGELGEAQFRNFATATEPDFSVSFVSMAAALLLAARLLSATVFDTDAPDRASMATLNFRNLEAGDDRISQDQSCAHCRTADRLSAA